MSSKFIIQRQDRPGSVQVWDDDRLAWGAEGSYSFYDRQLAHDALVNIPKGCRPIVVEIDDDADDEQEITEEGFG